MQKQSSKLLEDPKFRKSLSGAINQEEPEESTKQPLGEQIKDPTPVKKETTAEDTQKYVQGVQEVKQATRAGNVEAIPLIPKSGNKELDDPANQINDYKKKIARLFKEKRDEQSKSDLMELAETLGHAMIQWGAGAYGLKHNVDMSGVKFNKKDWASRLSSRLDLIDKEIAALEKGKEGVEAAEVAKVEAETAERHRREDMALKRELAAKKGEKGEEWGPDQIASYEADSDRLDRALEIFKHPDVKAGGAWGHFSKENRALGGSILRFLGFDEFGQRLTEGVEAERNVEAVVKKQMRAILGGQFAQREGEQLVRAMFDEKLPVETVIRNIERIKARLDKAKELRTSGKDVGSIKQLLIKDLSEFEKSQGKKPEKKEEKKSDTVRMRAPDGSLADVPRDKIDIYKKKGAKLVE